MIANKRNIISSQRIKTNNHECNETQSQNQYKLVGTTIGNGKYMKIYLLNS